jgi:hypothetical protein
VPDSPANASAFGRHRAQHLLRSPKPVGVLQELCGLLVAHYAVRDLMVADTPADSQPDLYCNRNVDLTAWTYHDY